jgi:hypothetical protein
MKLTHFLYAMSSLASRPGDFPHPAVGDVITFVGKEFQMTLADVE